MKINPVAFSIAGFDIRWYGIFIGIGAMLAITLGEKLGKKNGLKEGLITDFAIYALIFGILGARLYYVIFEWDYYSNHLDEILSIRNGGLAIHGGIIFGVLSAYIFCRIKKYDFLSLLDVAAPSIILAQALGRWGNFFNMEAHGGPVSEGFISHFPEFIQKGMFIEGTYYHPTFLYESVWNIIVFCILMYMIHNVKTKGVIFFTYFGLYSIGRFFIEGLRTDSLMFLGLRTAQFVSLLGIIIWLSYLIYIYKKKNR